MQKKKGLHRERKNKVGLWWGGEYVSGRGDANTKGGRKKQRGKDRGRCLFKKGGKWGRRHYIGRRGTRCSRRERRAGGGVKMTEYGLNDAL